LLFIEIDGKNGMRAKFRIKNRVHSAALKSSFFEKRKVFQSFKILMQADWSFQSASYPITIQI